MVKGAKREMGYTVCKTLQELKRKAKYIKIKGAGVRESHVHDVIITKEAPNYSLD